ncbi:MAG: CSLREA domain-containing protein [Thermoanaerobaculia bacterium]
MGIRQKFPLLTLLCMLAAAPLVAATITVTTVADVDLDDGACSLREAIVAANDDVVWHGCSAGSGADRILFELGGASPIALAAALPPIEESLLLRGPDSGSLEISGGQLWPILDASTNTPGVWLGVEDLRLVDGAGDGGGALVVSSGTTAELRRVRIMNSVATVGGGALWVSGTPTSPGSATLVDCEIWGNSSLGPSGGGAIRIIGPGAQVVIRRSVLAMNETAGFNGGAIAVQNGNLVVESSTLSGNAADGFGGAIHANFSAIDGELRIVDTTISDNAANADSDGSGDGGGLSVVTQSGFAATIGIRNSIVAGNSDAGGVVDPDLYFSAGSTVDWASEGFNLIGSNAGATSVVAAGTPNGEGDQVGSAAVPIDPLLEPLNNWGIGALATHRPQFSPPSPALDAGGCPAARGDQRGYGDPALGRRIVDLAAIPDAPGSDGCDIGAHERNALPGGELFGNGFEEGNTLLWSTEVL